MPCHDCRREEIKKDPDFTDRVIVSDVWVDLPVEEQRNRARGQAPPLPPSFAWIAEQPRPSIRLAAEQPVNPTRERTNQEVENE